MWDQIAKIIREQQTFILTTHVHPEGDAIGSEVALARFLKDLGKQVTVVNSSPTPQNCEFLDMEREIKVFPDDYEGRALDGADAVVILDVNNWGHLGAFGDAIRASQKPRVCIDHHQEVEKGFAEVVVSDTSAAATGLLVYELIRFMKGEVTPRIAEAVYTAIITDTGTFRFSNTDERVLRAAADLVRLGIQPFVLHRQVFAKTPSAVKLLGKVLDTFESTPDGKLAWIHATQAMFQGAEADYEDSDGILDVVRAIRGLEFCLFFKELPRGRIKVSLRSNGRVDVHQIAKAYGGGGHRMAAGMTVEGPMAKAIASVVRVCASQYLPRE